MPKTLYEKIWDAHAILQRDDGLTLLHVGRHLAQDGSCHAFDFLRERGLAVRRPDQVFATPDHAAPSFTRDLAQVRSPEHRRLIEALASNTRAAGIMHFGLDDPRQGIVHVVGPEQGLSQPGMVLVCGDSHTSTHGAVGALAFGLGSSDILHVLATQATWQRPAKTMRIRVEGLRPHGVSAKDVILAIVAQVGTGGATGHVIEYAGSTIRGMSMEERLTVCNMSIEAGARAGLVAPDETTFTYLRGRPFAPRGTDWDEALAWWKQLPSDPDAVFDREVLLDAGRLAPMVTWGNSPEDALPVDARVPDPAAEPDPTRRSAMQITWGSSRECS
jgi:3-isopropylmalate/(R)-2-methylmalate dehydratase large subunit